MLLSKHYTPFSHCEIKADGDTRRFTGYASVWDSVDSYGDTVQRGAFTKSMGGHRPVRMFYNHDRFIVIGKWLRMEEDEKGLLVQGELTPGHSVANDIYASLKHGAIDGLSIGFYDIDSEERDDGGRLLKEIDLREVSVVSMPAEELATIASVKSAIEQAESIRDIERLLREQFTRSEAVALISRMKSFLRDAEGERIAEIRARDARTARAIELINSFKVMNHD